MLRRHRSAHARIWTGLAVILPLLLLGAALIRRNGPLETPAVQLSPPAGEARP